MKREQREPWLALQVAQDDVLVTVSLCGFCHYASWEGSCCDSELYCQHPLDDISQWADRAWQGDDCWGFRPRPKYRRIEDAWNQVGAWIIERQWARWEREMERYGLMLITA